MVNTSLSIIPPRYREQVCHWPQQGDLWKFQRLWILSHNLWVFRRPVLLILTWSEMLIFFIPYLLRLWVSDVTVRDFDVFISSWACVLAHLGKCFHASFWGSAPGYLIPLKGGVCSPVAKSYQVVVMKPRLRTRTLQGEPMRSGLVSYQEAGRLLECSLRTSVCPSRVNYSFCNNLLKPLWFQSCGIITFSMLSARLDNRSWGRDCMSCVWQSLRWRQGRRWWQLCQCPGLENWTQHRKKK